MIRGHFVLAPKHLDSQIRYVKHIFKDLFLWEALKKTHSICRKSDFEAFNLLEGVNPIRKCVTQRQKFDPDFSLKCF